ncbi:hydroxysteroid dehydrogenase-like protein 2 [Centruroides sculpturatus]|uniref:hydroxysteroid dehydrogenase-like protein 2 n=1 Tax=Centruroides sculpturatus TaxID=218467 RepID=UPI000C6D274B|nr:hydroxysteroid dehydrogenase-like protein 2 [Centruroides sculpturatus]
MPDFFLSDSDLESFGPIDNMKISELQGSAKEETAEASEIRTVFSKIKNLTNEELVKQTNGVFQFIVKDKDEISWYIDLKNGNGDVGQGDPPGSKADVTFMTDSKNFLKMFSGSLKPTSAFMAGSLRIKGNMALAMKLDKLLAQMKSKL